METPEPPAIRRIYTASGVSPGDVIAYVGAGRGDTRGGVRDGYAPPTERDWLRVTKVDANGVHGVRLHPEGEWDRDCEFVVVTRQIEDNGVERHA